MSCPICKSKQFYVKDSVDEFETYEFTSKGGQIIFDGTVSNTPELTGENEIFCQRCSWHGPYKNIQNTR
ncbi:MAG: hypothetical protein GY874_14895 [Desulfobacteraceae bacterium]|nr:hypothetical protein [Desulfobacteraceae bacterium]